MTIRWLATCLDEFYEEKKGIRIGRSYIDRETGIEGHVSLQGVFVQIGLVPNTEWLENTLEKNKMGEILVNEKGMTSMPGVFAAGDCTNSAYKQIVISMGSGATAALGAFDYLIRKVAS